MSASSQTVARFVTVTMGLVIGLTFLFGFGNVLNLALKLQVPAFVAPLVAPAVDLTVLGLLVGTRHLAVSGASEEVLRSARRLLLAASVVTLLLNVADPVFAGQGGKAAFDSVGPLLLIGVCEAGPGLLRALSATNIDLGQNRCPALRQQTRRGAVPRRRRSPRRCGVTGVWSRPPALGSVISTRSSCSGLGRQTPTTGDAFVVRSPRRRFGNSFGSVVSVWFQELVDRLAPGDA